MASIVNDKLLDRFTIKWRSEIGQYVGYSSLKNTTPIGSGGLYIGGGQHYYPYPDFYPKLFYKRKEPLPNYPLKIDHVKLTTELPRYKNGISRCQLTISDIEAPTIVVNAGFSFRVFYPSLLLSYVFTNLHKPKIWKDHKATGHIPKYFYSL